MLAFRSTPTPQAEPREPWVPPLFSTPLVPGERACCCPARAVYTALLPATPEQAPLTILLCSHHARTHAAALSRSEIALYDARGCAVEPGAPELTWDSALYSRRVSASAGG